MKKIILLLAALSLTAAAVRASSDTAIDVSAGSRETIKSHGAAKKNMVRLMVRAGTWYDDNVYRYSQEYIDTFNLGRRLYRYPGVKKITDALFPMEAQITADMGNFFARANLSGKLYGANSQMNNLVWIFSMGWNGPISVCALYQLIPYHPVRPQSIAPSMYELMTYLENKGTLSAQLNLWKIKPFVEVAAGYYDYTHSFNNYDAPFYEGGLGVALAKPPLGMRIRCDMGFVSPKPNTDHQDWSNTYGYSEADVNYFFKRWTLGIKGSVKDRVYTTQDSSDSHKGRNDFVGKGNLYVKYRLHNLAVTATTGYNWRKTTSPIPRVETRKTYGVFSGGVDFSWEFKKKY